MVLLTIKNLQHQTFTIEIDMSASVKDLKEKIEKDKGSDYPAGGQKLIYAGKILQDDQILETYVVDVNKFIVIMVSKPKPEESASAARVEESPSVPATTSSSAETSTQESSSATTSAPSSSTTTTTTTSSSTPATAESMLVMGEEFNAMVQNIMEMGYDRPQVERALRASFNNPHAAVQYLIEGIPEGADDEREPPIGGNEASPAQGGEWAAAAAAAAGEVEAPAAANNDPLSFLQSQPQFRQMTQMMRTNPQLLDAFLQQIRTTNPALLQAIQDNQEDFVRLINQPATEGGAGANPARGGGGGGGGGGAAGEGDRSTTTIMLTPQDREAIDRLLLLGNFPEELVVQAYFACEKNENQAAEFLFSQAMD